MKKAWIGILVALLLVGGIFMHTQMAAAAEIDHPLVGRWVSGGGVVWVFYSDGTFSNQFVSRSRGGTVVTTGNYSIIHHHGYIVNIINEGNNMIAFHHAEVGFGSNFNMPFRISDDTLTFDDMGEYRIFRRSN